VRATSDPASHSNLRGNRFLLSDPKIYNAASPVLKWVYISSPKITSLLACSIMATEISNALNKFQQPEYPPDEALVRRRVELVPVDSPTDASVAHRRSVDRLRKKKEERKKKRKK
jgi:hypothetical protein